MSADSGRRACAHLPEPWPRVPRRLPRDKPSQTSPPPAGWSRPPTPQATAARGTLDYNMEFGRKDTSRMRNSAQRGV
jgi:hypothetical protein